MGKSQKLDFANIILHSFGQIMLQENRYTGLLFMLGILIGDWQYLLAALLAVLSGNGAALLLGFDRMNLNSGIYGFSPALVGVVLLFLFESSWSLWLLVMIGGFLSALLQETFIRLKIAGYTFPFILVSWILIGFINHYSNIGDSQITQWKGDFLSNEIIGLGFKGFGQVIFQEGFLVGILFFVGVCLSSSISGIYGIFFRRIYGLFISFVNRVNLSRILVTAYA